MTAAFFYFLDHLKEMSKHPYILEGEMNSDTSRKTILLYRVRGKRDVFEQPAQDICNNPNMLNKFHPMDIRTIAYITGAEQILELKPEERSSKFIFLKKKIFKK